MWKEIKDLLITKYNYCWIFPYGIFFLAFFFFFKLGYVQAVYATCILFYSLFTFSKTVYFPLQALYKHSNLLNSNLPKGIDHVLLFAVLSMQHVALCWSCIRDSVSVC